MLIVLADAGGYVDDAIESLSGDNVYVSTEVPDAGALHTLIDQQVCVPRRPLGAGEQTAVANDQINIHDVAPGK